MSRGLRALIRRSTCSAHRRRPVVGGVGLGARVSCRRASATDCLERRLAEHEPVVHEHVVGVELVGRARSARASPRLRNDFHTASSSARRARAARGRRARPSCAGRAHRAPRCAAFVRGSLDAPLVDDEHLALGGAVRQRRAQREADHLLGGALACSRAASGRAPRRRRASAARGSSPGGRGRCPSGATASHRRRWTSARVLVLLRAGAGGGELRGDDLVHDRRRSGSMPNSSSGTSTRPGGAAGGRLHVELHRRAPRSAARRRLHRVAHEHDAAGRARAPRPSRAAGRARRRPRPPRG